MLATAELATWVKAPSNDAAVVIVSSASLPRHLIDTLHLAIVDWDEVAYLCVNDTDALQQNWLNGESRQGNLNPSSNCQASAILRSISKRCYLLDVEENGGQARLAWLGSVCGHQLRFLQLDQVISPDSPNATLERQAERVLYAARGLVKGVLEERYLAL